MTSISKGWLLAGAAFFVAQASPAFAAAGADAAEQDQREGYAEDDGSSGTKTPTPVIDVPQTITFITEDQLEDQSIRQLGDALRYVPGISIETGEGRTEDRHREGGADQRVAQDDGPQGKRAP